MQVIDFFSPRWHSEYINEPVLYIYDRGGCNDVAKISTRDSDKDTSVNVHNPSACRILFLPVDHNLDIRKPDSDEIESTCDYLLTVNDKERLIFGEIKTGRRGWASEGMKQVKRTMDIFFANHHRDQWLEIRAYVSNYRRWSARESTRCVEETFQREMGGIRLFVQNDIHIDGENRP